MERASSMAASDDLSVSVIDFRRHAMVLRWHTPAGTWTAHDLPPTLVHGVAYISASHPNICLYAIGGELFLQIGDRQYAVTEDSPRIRCTAVLASFGLRRRFTVESNTGGVLFRHAYWAHRRNDFFHWLARKAGDPAWRTRSGRRWSEGVGSAALRSDEQPG
jgi:hypothetical protein